MALATLNLSYKENNGKTSSTGVRIAATTLDTALVALDTAFRTITLGSSTKATKSLDVALYTPDGTVPPVSAQRGQKFLFSGLGTDGNTYTLTLGTADSSIISSTGSDIVDLADIPTVVAALEAVWVDDQEGAITVQSCRYVNHNIQ